MTPFSSTWLLTSSFNFKPKSSSSTTSTSLDNYMHGPGDAYSPSLPLSAPLHLTRRNECMEWQTGDYFDDPDGTSYNQQDKFADATRPWCRTRPLPPHMHRPLPSLVSKFSKHALQSDVPLSYNPSQLLCAPRITSFGPRGDSAIADDGEEYDLESMDIHIRETYFATSAERGRWLSSPIAPRRRSQAIPPMRGHSSPIKSLTDASSRRSRRHNISRSVDEEILTSPSKHRDEDVRYSSPLPPSSPLTSPMSNPPSLSDCDSDFVVDPYSNSDDYHSLTGTPELSVSSTTCTSPVEPARTPTPHEVPTTVPTPQPIDVLCLPTHSIISRRTSSCSPRPIDLHVHTPGVTDFEPDDILSPLSQFELDLPEAESPELPVSDAMNTPYPGQQPTAEVARSRDELLSMHSLSANSDREPLEVLQNAVGGSGSNKTSRRRGSATGNPGAKRTRKAKKRRGMECHPINHAEPPIKKSKFSHCRADFGSREAKALPRETSTIKRLSRSSSRAVGEVLESAGSRDRKTPKLARRPKVQQPTLSPSAAPVSVNAIDAEFHASLTGMLVEALATSRATSMDASALCLVLTQAHPYLAIERSKGELLMNIAAVLEAGRTRCGMFEKVDCSGEKTRHGVLESRWFYVPEQDEDRERASLISALMPRQKRNETKKYKQYYYRPLDKMSRWDPEDAP